MDKKELESYYSETLPNPPKERLSQFQVIEIINKRVLEIMMNPEVKFYFDIGEEYDAVKIALKEYSEGYLTDYPKK